MNHIHKLLIESILEEDIKSKALAKLGSATKAGLDIITKRSNKLASMRKGHINFSKLKDRYGDLLKPSIDIRKTQVAKKARAEKALSTIQDRSKKHTDDVQAVQDELQRRWKTSPARRPDASPKQIAKWKATEKEIISKANPAQSALKRKQDGIEAITKNFNNSAKDASDSLQSLRSTAVLRSGKLRKTDIKNAAKKAGVGAGATTAAAASALLGNNVLKTKQSEYSYEKLKNAIKACKETYGSPSAIKKCQTRLYDKFKTSKVRQTIDSITG